MTDEIDSVRSDTLYIDAELDALEELLLPGDELFVHRIVADTDSGKIEIRPHTDSSLTVELSELDSEESQ